MLAHCMESLQLAALSSWCVLRCTCLVTSVSSYSDPPVVSRSQTALRTAVIGHYVLHVPITKYKIIPNPNPNPNTKMTVNTIPKQM